MPDRKITFTVSEEVASRIEYLSEQPINEIAKELIEGYLGDGRRRLEKLVRVPVSWPPDWYKMFLRVWGENKVAASVREVTREFIMRDPTRGKWVPSDLPDMRNRVEHKVNRKPKLRPDGNTFIGHALMPIDWVEWMDESYPGKRSTYIKLALYNHISDWKWPSGTEPSIPKGLMKFMDDVMK